MTEPKVPLKRTEIATLCQHCSKEFEMFKDDTGDPTLVWNWCPHCGERNNFWYKFLSKWDLRPENRPPMGLTAMQAHEKFQSSTPSERIQDE